MLFDVHVVSPPSPISKCDEMFLQYLGVKIMTPFLKRAKGAARSQRDVTHCPYKFGGNKNQAGKGAQVSFFGKQSSVKVQGKKAGQ